MSAADGKWKVTLEGAADCFTDCGKTAIQLAQMFRMGGHDASAWEKDRSGWSKVYPGPHGISAG